MSKFLRIVIILGVLGVLGYGFFLFFVSPSANNDPVTLVDSYFTNIAEADVCETHFNSETVSVCETFKTSLTGKTYTYEKAVLGNEVIVTLTIGENSETFMFSFLEEESTGLKAFFHPTVYQIDLIQ